MNLSGRSGVRGGYCRYVAYICSGIQHDIAWPHVPLQVIAQNDVIRLCEHCPKILFIQKRQEDVFKLYAPVDRSKDRAIGNFHEVTTDLADHLSRDQYRIAP